MGVAAHLLRRGEWEPTPARTVAEVEGFTPVEAVELSKYGGRRGASA